MKIPLVKNFQAKPEFFDIMKDIAELEQEFVEGKIDERWLLR